MMAMSMLSDLNDKVDSVDKKQLITHINMHNFDKKTYSKVFFQTFEEPIALKHNLKSLRVSV